MFLTDLNQGGRGIYSLTGHERRTGHVISRHVIGRDLSRDRGLRSDWSDRESGAKLSGAGSQSFITE